MGNTVVILTYGADAPVVEGKFLQLIWRGREHLLFSPRTRHLFHNEILGTFLAERRIDHHWLNDQTLHIDADDLRIIGGGRFVADAGSRTLRLSDNSQAYGRFDENGLPEKIAAAESPWQTFSITIAG